MNLTPMAQPRFSSGDIAEITGLSAATVQTWVNRGVVQPSDPNPGRGERRRFSGYDVLRFGLTSYIVDCPFPLAMSGKIAGDAARVIAAKAVEFFSWAEFVDPGYGHMLHVALMPDDAEGYSIIGYQRTSEKLAGIIPTSDAHRVLRLDLTPILTKILPELEKRFAKGADD